MAVQRVSFLSVTAKANNTERERLVKRVCTVERQICWYQRIYIYIYTNSAPSVKRIYSQFLDQMEYNAYQCRMEKMVIGYFKDYRQKRLWFVSGARQYTGHKLEFHAYLIVDVTEVLSTQYTGRRKFFSKLKNNTIFYFYFQFHSY